MKARLFQMANSPFARAVAVLSSGQAVAMILPLLAAPILGRLYTPAEYGLLALYMATAGLLAVLSTGQYTEGIIAASSTRQAQLLAVVCLVIGAFCAIISLALVLVVNTFFVHTQFAILKPWAFALPLITFAASFVAASTALANRMRRYGAIARNPVYAVTGTIICSIALGYVGWGLSGLMAGYLVGQTIQVMALGRLWPSMMDGHPPISLKRLSASAKRFRQFPIYVLPSALLTNLNQQLPIYALGALGAAQELGQFNRARQLCAMPVTLLGSSIAQVYRQDAAEMYRVTGSCRKLLMRTGGLLLGAGILPLLAFVALAPNLFAIYLGAPWYDAGVIARILAPMLLLRLVASPLSTTLLFSGHQRMSFILSTVSFAIISTALIFSVFYTQTVFELIFSYSIAMSGVYILYIIASFRVSQK